MKNLFQPAAFIALMCGIALAQNTTPSPANPGMPQPQAQPSAPGTSPQAGPQSQGARPNRIAPGSVIPVQLTKTVDAKKAKSGDQVLAKVTMDMKTQSGDVLVPKDTKVFGHVTEAQPRGKDQKESQLGIAFDHAVTKDGKDMQMPMSIQAVIGQQQNQADQSGAPAGGGGAAAPSGGGPPSGGSGGRSSGGMNGSSGASNTPPPSSAPSSGAGEAENAGGSRPPINAQTQGVIGISNLTLSSAANGSQGSVMISEKNNVKLDSGTMLLLKVNQ